MKLILITIFMLLSACKGLNNLNPEYKDRTVTLKKICLELKKEPINLDRITLLLTVFNMDEDKTITINELINTNEMLELDEGIQSLMHLAVMSFDPTSIELMRMLKDAGADINIKNYRGITPLHLACELGAIDKIKLLIKMGADTQAKDKYETTPLIAHILSDNLNWEVVNELLPPLKSINIKIGPESKTLLHFVCENFWKNSEITENIIKMLAREGADFNARDCRGNTLLHNLLVSSITNPVDCKITINMMELLVHSYQVDPNAINKEHKTILDIAKDHKVHEDIIRYLSNILEPRPKHEFANILEMFIGLIKSYGNVDVEDEGRRTVIHDTLQALWIQEDDFEQNNTKFLRLLAALFYARWTNDTFEPSMKFNIDIDPYADVDRTLSLAPIITLMETITNDDLDDDLKAEHEMDGERYGIYEIIENFVHKLVAIHNGTYMDGRASPLTKIKLQKLVSCLPKIINEPEKIRFVINTLLRQFVFCDVAVTLGLDQVFRYLGENVNENGGIETLVHQYLNELRKTTITDAVRIVYPEQDQQVHFDLQVLKHFASELKLMEQYEDPYNIRYRFDPDKVRDEFYKKYTYSLILETLKKHLMNANITSKLFDYVQEISGGRNVHLVHKIFFDKDDYSTKEEFIKALLLTLGYIARKDTK